jgi:peptidoglycan/LPS O-acetylase OafA/YrhL
LDTLPVRALPAFFAVPAQAPWNDPARWRQNNFGVMRVILALLVLVAHCFYLLKPNEANSTDPLARLTHGATQFGYVAVDGFFIVSGFLIASSWEQSRSGGAYLRKRVARIYPGFAAAYLLLAIFIPLDVTGKLSMVTLLKSPVHILLLNKFLYPHIFANNPYAGDANGSLWTIAYEFRCYLLLPFLALLGFPRRRWLSLALLAVSLALLPLVTPAWNFSRPFALRMAFDSAAPYPRLVSCFTSGIAFYAYRSIIPRSRVLALMSVVALAAASRSMQALDFLYPVVGTYLLLWLAYCPVGVENFTRHGDFSYGIYLYSFPIQQFFIERLGAGIGPWSLLTLALPFALAAGVLSWFVVERRFLRASYSRRPEIAKKY